MTDTPLATPLLPRVRAQSPAWMAGLRIIFLAVLLAVSIRTFVYEPFSIPSASMNPALVAGDYILVAKYPYGYGPASFPWGEFPMKGRIGAVLPERGDIIVFTDPNGSGTNFVKRVIGLPGDAVSMRDGRLVLNGSVLPRQRIGDYVHPVTPITPCDGGRDIEDACVYPRYRQSLGARDLDIIELGDRNPLDDMAAITVPRDRLFVMGDNRDNSEDSRVSPEAGGFGLVPMTTVVGRADRIFMSVDGTGEWSDPTTWPGAVRFGRIGLKP